MPRFETSEIPSSKERPPRANSERKSPSRLECASPSSKTAPSREDAGDARRERGGELVSLDPRREPFEEAIETFEEGMQSLRRFYVIRIQRPGDASKQADETKPVALIVVKFDMNQTPGAKAMNALWNMHEEGVMHHLFSMHMREDHAPMGSLCKAVQAALAKS